MSLEPFYQIGFWVLVGLGFEFFYRLIPMIKKLLQWSKPILLYAYWQLVISILILLDPGYPESDGLVYCTIIAVAIMHYMLRSSNNTRHSAND